MQAPTVTGRDSWIDGELMAFDLETTGVDPFSDVPVSFALVAKRNGVLTTERSLVDPGRDVPGGAVAVHGITTARARADGMPIAAAVATIAARLIDASRRGVPLVGMKLDYDLTMLDRCYRAATGRHLRADGFEGPVVDILVLDRHFDRFRSGKRSLGDLCRVYGVALELPHDAAADAVAALRVVEAMCRWYPSLREADARRLHGDQRRWHREWSRSMAAWRRRKGLRAVPEPSGWPISRASPSAGRGEGPGQIRGTFSWPVARAAG